MLWTLIGLLGATLIAVVVALFQIGARIDALGARIDGRIDALSARIDALDQRLTSRIDALSQKLDQHIERHAS